MALSRCEKTGIQHQTNTEAGNIFLLILNCLICRSKNSDLIRVDEMEIPKLRLDAITREV